MEETKIPRLSFWPERTRTMLSLLDLNRGERIVLLQAKMQHFETGKIGESASKSISNVIVIVHFVIVHSGPVVLFLRRGNSQSGLVR